MSSLLTRLWTQIKAYWLSALSMCIHNRGEFILRMRARGLLSGVCRYDDWLRNQLKHGDLSPEAFDALQNARNQLHNELPHDWVEW